MLGYGKARQAAFGLLGQNRSGRSTVGHRVARQVSFYLVSYPVFRPGRYGAARLGAARFARHGR
jgi:hypothetical protein